MCDAATWVGDIISLLNLVLTAGLVAAAFCALVTWRAQVLGGRTVQLAEQCLDAARDFGVRIKIVRMEESKRDGQIAEIRDTLLEFQRIFLRLNYYISPPIGNDVPDTLIKCFAILDTNFRILRGFEGGNTIEATRATAQEKQQYKHAHDIFYGLSDDDQIASGFTEAQTKLGNALHPILHQDSGWLGKIIDKIVTIN